MPTMDLTYPKDALAPDVREGLVEELTTILPRAERAPNTQFFRDVTWLFIHELEAGLVNTGGGVAPKSVFRLIVTTPQGALSDRRRAELVEHATKAICAAADIPADEALRVWVLCREIDEGSWGAGGQVIQFEQLRATAKAESAAAAAAAQA
jgi:phenylpyruvate tautomerase PptA (4-oxalocrotonate tautomerase family)